MKTSSLHTAGAKGRKLRLAVALVLGLASGAAPAGSLTAMASTLCAGDLCGPEDSIRLALSEGSLSERIAAWGRSTGEVRHDLERLSVSEHRRLAGMLSSYHGAGGDDGSHSEMAMYLVMVSLMRESRLFSSVVSRLAR